MSISDEDRVDTVVAVAEYLLEHRRPEALFTFMQLDEQVKHAFESTDGFRRFVRDVLEPKGMLVWEAGGGRRTPLVFRVENWELIERLQEPEEASKFLFASPLPDVLTETPGPAIAPEEDAPSKESDDEVLAQYFAELLSSVKAINAKVDLLDQRTQRLADLKEYIETHDNMAEELQVAHECAQDARTEKLVGEVKGVASALLNVFSALTPKFTEAAERVEKATLEPIRFTDGFEAHLTALSKRVAQQADTRLDALTTRYEELEKRRDKYLDRLHKILETNAATFAQNSETYSALSEILKEHIAPLVEAGVTAASFIRQIDHVLVGKARLTKMSLRQVREDILAAPDPNDAISARYLLPDEARKKANGGTG